MGIIADRITKGIELIEKGELEEGIKLVSRGSHVVYDWHKQIVYETIDKHFHPEKYVIKEEKKEAILK